MQNRRTKEENQELVVLYKESGKTIRAFVKEFNVNLSKLRNWLYRKQEKSSV